jgi:hypothetical protein
MAATGFTPIQLYFSTTASAVPVNTNLANGELAVNITDGKLFYKDNSGTVQTLATKGSGTIGGSTTQVQYNNAGSLAGSSAFTFDSATGTVSSTIYTGRLKAYEETVNTIGTVSGTTQNLDLSTANIFDVTLGNNVTFTFTNPPSSGVSKLATVILRQDATGSRLATFTNAKYTDGNLPQLSTGANQIDVLTFFTVNGGSFWFGTFAMANVS